MDRLKRGAYHLVTSRERGIPLCVRALELSYPPCAAGPSSSLQSVLYDDDLGDLTGKKLLRALRSRTLGAEQSVPTAEGTLEWLPGEMARAQLSGKENVVGITALGKAFLLLERVGMATIQSEERRLTARLLGGVRETPGIQLNVRRIGQRVV